MIPMGKAKEISARSLATAQALLRDPTKTSRPYQSAVVKVKSAQRTQEVEDQIKKMGFSAFSVIDALQGAKRIFLIEASAIGFFGGITGVILGWVVGRLINIGANIYIQQQGGAAGNLFSLPFWLIGGAIGFSIAISLLAGSYPAARAAKLDPIQALRHD